MDLKSSKWNRWSRERLYIHISFVSSLNISSFTISFPGPASAPKTMWPPFQNDKAYYDYSSSKTGSNFFSEKQKVLQRANVLLFTLWMVQKQSFSSPVHMHNTKYSTSFHISRSTERKGEALLPIDLGNWDFTAHFDIMSLLTQKHKCRCILWRDKRILCARDEWSSWSLEPGSGDEFVGSSRSCQHSPH